jgi:hypothetical protein
MLSTSILNHLSYHLKDPKKALFFIFPPQKTKGVGIILVGSFLPFEEGHAIKNCSTLITFNKITRDNFLLTFSPHVS